MTGPSTMPKPDDDAPATRTTLSRIAPLLTGGIALIFGIGVIAGLLSAHSERGGPMSATQIGILAGVIVATAAIGLFMLRKIRALARSDEQPTPRERRNRNVLVLAMATGGAIGFVLALAGGFDGGPGPATIFSGPLQPALAIILALIIAIPLPLLCYYWHRRVADEQEAAAYREGALIGLYTYWIGAPVWWLLWRGGLVPAPDGVAIYFIVTFIAGAVWLHAKYR